MTARSTTTLRSERQPYRLLLTVLPLYLWRPLVFEGRLLLVKLRGRAAQRSLRGRRDLRVNVGCGTNGFPGWVNVDVFAGPTVTCVYDCRTSLPVEPGSTRVISAEHFFEHLDRDEEAPRFLKACHRALRPGGVLRIVVPDAEKYVRAYSSDGWTDLQSFSPLLEAAPNLTKMDVLNHHFRQGYQHKWVYDFESLERVLREAGFREIVRSQYNASAVEELRIDSPQRAAESLYVEATV
jgi:predicted SAM-dependent methyltransferase